MATKSRIWLVYVGGFLYAIHFASVAYINSSLLLNFVGDGTLNILYILSSVLGIVFLALMPLLLRKFGSVPIFLFFILLEIAAMLGMGILSTALIITLLFLLHYSSESILSLCLDVNLEQKIQAEGTTGRKRGIFLTFMNVGWLLAPVILGVLVTAGNYGKIYIFSAIALVPLFIITLFFFKNIKKADELHTNVFRVLRSLGRGGDKARIIMVQLVLQFFFAWMVIYMPLLLSREMGLGWDKIGIIFTFMLLPFLLFELPAGFLGDKKLGEKEIMITGFIIMVLATLSIPFIHSPIVWLWAAVLFLTRTGASLIEISSESYFFKHVKEEDTGLISIFRTVRPLSYIIAPLLALPVIYFFSYSVSFFFLAVFASFGLLFIPKKDTR